MSFHDEKVKELMGYGQKKPWVQFFDHAVPDAKLTEESGRPRFVELVYIRKISSAPELVVRDVFDRKMQEQDKTDFAEEWELYCKRKEAITNLNPSVDAVPGMGVAEKAELAALEIHDCQKFVDYEGDLTGLEQLRQTALRILEISDAVREERQDVRNTRGRESNQDANSSVHWLERRLPTYTAKEEKESHQKGDKEEAVQTFHYEVTI